VTSSALQSRKWQLGVSLCAKHMYMCGQQPLPFVHNTEKLQSYRQTTPRGRHITHNRPQFALRSYA